MSFKLALPAMMTVFALVFAGCAQVDDVAVDPEPITELLDVVLAQTEATMVFSKQTVTAATQFAADLYEPTMEVSDSGVIYIAGHTIAADTTGAPAYFSKDDGVTWEQLPFAGPATMPGGVHGATPPPSDEIFIIAGDDGWAYGVDITLATFPVNMWSGDGSELAYHNPNAYDMLQANQRRAEPGCSYLSLNDRPWAAYANDTLLLVNNPGGGPVQVGVMTVPPALPVGGPAVGPGAAEWNLCASSGGYIPGIPDIREDGFFVVPQIQGNDLVAVMGHKDNVMETTEKSLFSFTPGGSITSQYGQAVFDAEGSLFVAIQDNQEEDSSGNREGRITVATSADGETFTHRSFVMEDRVTSFYMDGNFAGPGAMLSWAVPGDRGTDWYVGHLFMEDGAPVLKNVALAVDEGPRPSAHVTGAAIGPDGRAYLAAFESGPVGGTPLSVFVQQDGPAMPLFDLA